jgi:hypothetical protein
LLEGDQERVNACEASRTLACDRQFRDGAAGTVATAMSDRTLALRRKNDAPRLPDPSARTAEVGCGQLVLTRAFSADIVL